MSVDTNVKNKNLAPYRRLRHEQFRILITPQLIGMAESLRIVTTGSISKKLKVEFRAAPAADTGSCEVC
ncbi:MAG: hypothetical protein ABJH68_07795 [Ilumatobacter sp.]|uniref:hypothetical protein n=1 Tax=Ilumatobacter sp. TaxID=1967498 RepID=UPI003298DD6E